MTTAPRQPTWLFFGKQNKIFDRGFLCVMKMRIDLRNTVGTNWMSGKFFSHSLEILQPFFFIPLILIFYPL